MSNCAACPDAIDDNNFIKCNRCSKKFHLLCINIKKGELEKAPRDYESNWLCPICLNKQPKSDNSRKPVRPTTPTGMADMTFINTRRKLHSRTDSDPSIHLSSASDAGIHNIREIIRDELRGVMKDFMADYMTDFKNTIKSQFSEIMSEINEFKNSLEFISEGFDSMKKELSAANAKIALINKENETLRSDIYSLKLRLNTFDQLSRSSNLEIQCVPERKAENLIIMVQELGKSINFNLNEKDISYCSRTAKLKSDSPRPRSILVKLNSPRTRDCFLAAAIEFNKKNHENKLNTGHIGILSTKVTPIYVTENLSPENKHLHAAARKVAKEKNYKFVWIRGGRVYLRKTETSEAIFVRNEEVLEKLNKL
ncbi:unnamed protein product [Chilo suppressalis]|uniref:PHD-type domain-containing protein n=1 Tax=Chilo suppressalis TaxID=168631 RepID=A0ABN8AZP1_CHISP|nr:unnamed protein product [Chilo suppressalis]